MVVLLIKEGKATTYNSEERLNQEEYKVERHNQKDGKLTLHEFADQSKLEEEGLPDQEEEPKYEAEVHHYLKSKLICHHSSSLILPNCCKGNVYETRHVRLIQRSVLEQAIRTQVIEEG